MVGEEDTVFVDRVRAIAATVPGAELTVIPAAGHSPQFENPPEWRRAARFLGSL